MRLTIIRLIIVNLLIFCATDSRAQDGIRDLVVKIHAVHHTPDLMRPWTKNSPQQVKGSGVVIEGKRILTNAHVVRYSNQIYVQPNQSAHRIPAKVEAISPSI
ncbi:MAG: serine protease, partial [Deltaproteobacteria bacterium]|nr:serine protease [Deltaproteobacteria bacterium]